MISSRALKDIVAEARPIIERQLDDAEIISGLRDVVASQGGDWSALKALIKAQIQDERDETGNGKRVKKIIDKADFSTGYADMLGWRIMNEKNFSAEEDFDPITGEFLDDEQPETANEHPHHLKTTGGDESGTLKGSVEDHRQAAGRYPESQMDGETSPVTAGETAPHSPIAPASQGEAEAPTPKDVSLPTDGVSSEGVNAGGNHEVAKPSNAAPRQAGALVKLAPAAHPVLAIRPFCQHPGEEVCGGSGRQHCRKCTAAMREEELA